MGLPLPDVEPEGGQRVALYQALPVPHVSSPIHEILEFKHRRHDELLALRAHLDTLYRAVEQSPDPSAFDEEFRRLDEALADHIKVAREWKTPFVGTNLKITLGLKTWTAAAASFGGVAKYGLPLSIAALAGLTGGAAAAVEKSWTWRGYRPRGGALEYASAYVEELRL